MKYTANITLTFTFDVPGDDPEDDVKTRNVDTAEAAATVANAVVDRLNSSDLADYLSRFDDPHFTVRGGPAAT